MPGHKPEGYPTVSAYLVVAGAQKVIDFAKRVFDATEQRRYDGPEGGVRHAELKIGDSVVMLGDAGEQCPPMPAFLHVYVENVDATYRRALEAGGVPVQEPVQKGDEDKRGGVRDPGGITWWIATQVG